jgi:hypothetical protein
VTAGIEALATGGPEGAFPEGAVPDGAVPAGDAPDFGVAPGGGGGGAVPTPNSPGEAVGDDGSANGADCAACCALVRSATSDAVSFLSSSGSDAVGLAGTVDMFG